MPFEQIENVGAPKRVEECPPEGVRVEAREVKMSRGGGRTAPYIQLSIGWVLAKSLGFHADTHRVQLLFGTGRDSGKIQISVDNKDGAFEAKRRKGKPATPHRLTINARTAAGRFALKFPAFAISRLEVLTPAAGGQRSATFPASPEMLAVGDE